MEARHPQRLGTLRRFERAIAMTSPIPPPRISWPLGIPCGTVVMTNSWRPGWSGHHSAYGHASRPALATWAAGVALVGRFQR